jgi:hypothetical protein
MDEAKVHEIRTWLVKDWHNLDAIIFRFLSNTGVCQKPGFSDLDGKDILKHSVFRDAINISG